MPATRTDREPPLSPRKDYIPELDGIRALAVLLVLWQHSPDGQLGLDYDLFKLRVQPGYLGVDIFFVLSGFLITRILLVDRERGVPLRNFLMRRLLRIFPIYYLTLLVVWLLDGWSDVLPWCFAYLSNFWLAFNPAKGPLDHTWSLAVEEHFYLVWPWIVYGLSPRLGRLVPWVLFVPLALVWAYVVSESYDLRLASDYVLRGTMFRALSLSIGAAFAFSESRLRSSRPLCLGIASASLLAGLAGHAYYWSQVAAGYPDFPRDLTPLAILVVYGAISSGVVLGAIGIAGTRFPVAWLLRSRFLRGIGRISYALYLYHVPIIHALGAHGDPVWGMTQMQAFALAMVLTFAAATASYFLIERPILRLAARFRSS